MKSRIELMNEILTSWQKADEQYSDNFRYDGIIDEAHYENVNPKILFICKEPNAKNHTNRFVGDFRKEWREEGAPYPLAYRIAEWSYGIHNKFPPLDTLLYAKNWEEECRKALSAIAFMNLKKSPGSGNSILPVMLASLRKEKAFILEQIKIIAPEIIILGLSWPDLRLELTDIPHKDWTWSGYQIAIARWNNARVIDFYHPSSRNAPAAAYCLLQNVIQSKSFRDL